MLARSEAEVGFTRADSAADEGPSDGSIVALASLYDSYVQVVVRASSNIDEIADLAGRAVAVGRDGSGTQLIASRVLAAAKLGGPDAVRRDRRFDVEQGTRALEEGVVDAVFWAGGLPTPSIERLRKRIDVRLIDLGALAARLRAGHPDLYTVVSLPRKAYRLKQNVRTVSVRNYLAARRDLPKSVAYRLTKLLFDQRDALERAHAEATRLSLRAAIETDPLELHPGAAEFYRDAGG